MWIARYYQCDEPNTCFISNGFCSMGFALPGAIAAQMVFPERRVLAICGDGGFLMNVQEMETTKRLGTNIVAMVWKMAATGSSLGTGQPVQPSHQSFVWQPGTLLS